MLPLGALKAVDASASRERTEEEPSMVLMIWSRKIDLESAEDWR
jgi:hypothetical protein